jgi:flagellar basal-body rod protein FlgB
MINNILSSKSFKVTQMGLEAANLAHSVISNNIANVNTPGFKANGVFFMEKLRESMEPESLHGRTNHSRHIPIGYSDPSKVTPEIVPLNYTSYRNDKNNVDMDTEIANLSKNSLYYQGLLRFAQSEIGGIANAIKKGMEV